MFTWDRAKLLGFLKLLDTNQCMHVLRALVNVALWLATYTFARKDEFLWIGLSRLYLWPRLTLPQVATFLASLLVTAYAFFT